MIFLVLQINFKKKQWYELHVAKLQKNVGVFRSRKKNIFGIGIGKKLFSESELGFGIKKCDSADHKLEEIFFYRLFSISYR
jgi:hypothetical protein